MNMWKPWVNRVQNRQLEALNKELNKAYLIIGTYDELKDKGVVDKEGGFLGLIGRKMTLQENADLKQFMVVDKRDISRLTIDANRFLSVSILRILTPSFREILSR